jgi:halogenation protein CepH
MQSFIDSCAIVKEYLQSATRVTEGNYGKFRVRKDYSYTNKRFWAPGVVLIGDAACFIDPVFSSGVHLATYSALLAARSINTLLSGGGIDENACFDEFERRYRREYGNFYEFLLAFYDMHQDKESYFWTARKVLNTEEKANDAFIRLVAGVGSTGEPLYGRAEDFFTEREGVGDMFQQWSGKGTMDDLFQTSENNKIDPNSILGELKREVLQMETQAILGERRAKELPLFEGGLIPSKDGFHWSRPYGSTQPSRRP